jgi:hypothetical protein
MEYWMEAELRGRIITRAMVERLLAAKAGEEFRVAAPSGVLSFIYRGKRSAKSIKIGCQRFPLTKIEALLSLFPTRKKTNKKKK